MSDGYRIDPDYVDVATRIQEFYAKYPDGALVTVRGPVVELVGEKPYVWCQAEAWRAPDDPHPAVGTAWEPIPGPTPFTRDSEAMNAETAAWGRAIIATGIPSKKIASADEVQARQETPSPARNGEEPRRSDAQNRKMRAVLSNLDKSQPRSEGSWSDYAKEWTLQQFGKSSSKDLTKAEAGQLIDHLEAQEIPFG